MKYEINITGAGTKPEIIESIEIFINDLKENDYPNGCQSEDSTLFIDFQILKP